MLRLFFRSSLPYRGKDLFQVTSQIWYTYRSLYDNVNWFAHEQLSRFASSRKSVADDGEEVVKYERISVAVMVVVVVVVAIIFADSRDHRQEGEETKKKSYTSSLRKKKEKEIDVNNDLSNAENSYMAHSTLLCLSLFSFRSFLRSSLSRSPFCSAHTDDWNEKKKSSERDDDDKNDGDDKDVLSEIQEESSQTCESSGYKRMASCSYAINDLIARNCIRSNSSWESREQVEEFRVQQPHSFVCARKARVLLFAFFCFSSDFLSPSLSLLSCKSRGENMHINLKAIVSNERIIFDWLA